jgi:AcrR family transcriptional regulator
LIVHGTTKTSSTLYDVTRGNPERPRKRTGEAIKQLVAEQVAEKVAAKADKHASKLDRFVPVAHDVLDLWTRTEPGARKPRFTRDEIAAAAVRIADDEGIGALSMRRLAAELEAGTMTLYHYVRTKDELLTLVTDAVMAELLVPDDEMPADWRDAMTLLAHTSRAALVRHPWVFDIVDDPAVGPNGVRHFDQSLQAVASLPGTLEDKLDVIAAVDEYVFGYCLHARNDFADGDGPKDDRAMVRYVAELARGGGYPRISALIEAHGVEPLWHKVSAHGRDEHRFDRNLARLLDGIHRDLTP